MGIGSAGVSLRPGASSAVQDVLALVQNSKEFERRLETLAAAETRAKTEKDSLARARTFDVWERELNLRQEKTLNDAEASAAKSKRILDEARAEATRLVDAAKGKAAELERDIGEKRSALAKSADELRNRELAVMKREEAAEAKEAVIAAAEKLSAACTTLVYDFQSLVTKHRGLLG